MLNPDAVNVTITEMLAHQGVSVPEIRQLILKGTVGYSKPRAEEAEEMANQSVEIIVFF